MLQFFKGRCSIHLSYGTKWNSIGNLTNPTLFREHHFNLRFDVSKITNIFILQNVVNIYRT